MFETVIASATSSPVLALLLLIALGGLSLAVFTELLQTIAKYRGYVSERIAQGYNSAMKVMVVNRVGGVLYYLCLSFNIDSGLEAQTLAFALSLTALLLVLPSAAILIYLRGWTRAHAGVRDFIDVSSWPMLIVLATFIATTFNLLGYTVPWVAAAQYPEYRLTLANSSFLFNTVFTVVNVFYIEHKFAQLIDEKAEAIHGFVVGVIAARAAAYGFVALILALLW